MNQSVLMVLDVQKGFDDPYWGERNNPQAEENILRLLTEWRKRNGKVIYSQHLSLLPESPLYYKNNMGIEFKDIIAPQKDEMVFVKNVNSAFIGTHLETYLRVELIKSVVITGLSTQHCISTTTRMSGNLGFDTYLISDAIAAFGITDHLGHYHTADDIQTVEMACLQTEFSTILTTDQALKQLQDGMIP